MPPPRHGGFGFREVNVEHIHLLLMFTCSNWIFGCNLTGCSRATWCIKHNVRGFTLEREFFCLFIDIANFLVTVRRCVSTISSLECHFSSWPVVYGVSGQAHPFPCANSIDAVQTRFDSIFFIYFHKRGVTWIWLAAI